MSLEPKKILCLDFDGVIHSYVSGWKGATVIPDPLVKGALEFIAMAVGQFKVCIHSSRSHQDGGIEAMRTYLVDEFLMDGRWKPSEVSAIVAQIGFPKEKPPAVLTIDDRAYQFRGVWPTMREVHEFRPWYKP